ncbi:hypothetical protein [Chitinimonas sp. BJB300]|uniref:hypothetical protein n=1 Tax=Chitinimonas sp. BJB300 TaxID=1559339 RepID=UPI001C906710|nr:hypothetical protein [Chitinimonas sp. BJB300]
MVDNQVKLLQDGPITYTAMFAALSQAKDQINMETHIFEEDEVGRRFAELLVKKQAEGVQVNVIYDSVGSLNTTRAFFLTTCAVPAYASLNTTRSTRFGPGTNGSSIIGTTASCW